MFTKPENNQALKTDSIISFHSIRSFCSLYASLNFSSLPYQSTNIDRDSVHTGFHFNTTSTIDNSRKAMEMNIAGVIGAFS